MDSSNSSIPRPSGLPRPTSRLPVLRASTSQSAIRPAVSSEQLQKKASTTSLSRPAQPTHGQKELQKKPSRVSLSRASFSSSPNANPARAPLQSATSATKRTVSSIPPKKPASNDAAVFKKPIGRPVSRQLRRPPSKTLGRGNISREDDDELGDLDGFRSSSRASSRQDFREPEPESAISSEEGTEGETPEPRARKSRPSLSDRTIESLASIPASPAGKGRRRSSFFAESPMPPPARPASALGNHRRPTTSDGTPRNTPITPSKRGAGLSQRGFMTAPGKRSVSAALPSVTSTPSRLGTARPSVQTNKQPLGQLQNVQGSSKPRPLSTSKTMVARTPKSRPSLTGVFGSPNSPPGSSGPTTPTPGRGIVNTEKSPETARKISSSSAALREQIAKAKAASRSGGTPQSPDSTRKGSSSSGALREQIAKAKEAARRAAAASKQSEETVEFPAVTENEHGIVPDPAEIATFDFGLDDDPFNQRPKGSASLLRKRIDGARADGRLNIAAMGLTEFPEDVMRMYQFDPNNSNIAWGETVDLTVMIVADNDLQTLPDELFPDVDINALDCEDDNAPQFGGVQSLDLHGNVLRELPTGLRRLQHLTKLNLSRNRLSIDIFDMLSQVQSLRDLKLADNALQGSLPSQLGQLSQLEVLELQGNKLARLPEEIQELVHLRTLNVSDNQLKALPSGLFTNVPLIELLATKNAFSDSFFPQSVDSVPHLQILHLSSNAITSFCEAGTILMPALKTLDISRNRLASLPDISTWTSLVTLLAGENKLATLPEGFVSSQSLRTADFSGNDLTKLDERIALMESLDNLTLAANPLSVRKYLTMNTEDIKRDLLSKMEPSAEAADEYILGQDGVPGAGAGPNDWALKPSGTLDLSGKDLSGIDEAQFMSFSEAHDVRQLYLQQNSFPSVPPIITQLNSLTVLDLSKNGMIRALDAPLTLSRLREFRLANNKLPTLESLTTYLSAPALQHLDVTNNRISGALPILRNSFPELSLLMAGDNAIEEVSAGALEGLKTVNLSNNDIGKLEPRIGLLAGTLTGLEVEGNTFRVPGYMVLQKGTDAVLAWLRDKIPASAGEEF